MPDTGVDRTHLDKRLAEARTGLLDEIQTPAFSTAVARATALRRRRHAVRSGAALIAVAAVASISLQPWRGGQHSPAPAATPTPSTQVGPVYTDAGITVNGLHADVTDVPGDVRDVEFTGPDEGWTLSATCPADASALCRMSLGSSNDGGMTWAIRPIAGYDARRTTIPDLIALDGRTLVVRGADRAAITTDGGVRWQAVTPDGGNKATLTGTSRAVLRSAATGSCAGAVVEVWAPAYGYRGDVTNPPPLDVCWVAARPAGAGWWVGGTANGRPAVAVTADGGVTWQPTVFDTPGDSARVSFLGSNTYVAVTARENGTDALRAIYHAAGTGARFTRTWAGTGAPNTIGGELIPLLDGRLLVVDGNNNWFVSETNGATFIRTDELPGVSRVWRTPAGYIAFDIVAEGWAAFSSDGSTWRKLHVH